MSVFEEFRNIFKTLGAYLLGRGALSLLMMGTIFITGTAASTPVLALVAVGGLAISAGMRLYSQSLYEDDMANLYREDIAKHLGMDPKHVTRQHLKLAAYENEVIDQALKRQRRINIVSFATSALAAAATFGLLMFGLAGNVTEFFRTTFPALDEIHFGFLGLEKLDLAKVVQYASTGIVSGFSSLILHNGLEEVIGFGSGISKAVAHDLIAQMDIDVRKGKTITPEQVYGVLVAENPELQSRIERLQGEPFHRLSTIEKRTVMDVLGVTKDMEEIAGFITRREVPPGRLAYMMHYARPPKAKTLATAETAPEPQRSSFVEKLGLSQREDMSHVDRLHATPREQLALL